MTSDSKALLDLFRVYSELEKPPIIELQNIDHKPVGAIYLNRFIDKDKIVLSETNNQERYYLYVDGIGIYFSFFKKLGS